MKDRDQELDHLLKPLMDLKPTGLQTRRWMDLQKKQTRLRRYIIHASQLAVACLIGFVLGHYFKSQPAPVQPQQFAINFDPDATIEVVYSKNR